MKICSRCHVLCENVCPKCGAAKHLQAPEENQPALHEFDAAKVGE